MQNALLELFSRLKSLLLTCWGNGSHAFIHKRHNCRLHLYFPINHYFHSSPNLIQSRSLTYSLCHKHLDNFAFDSDTNSVTSENPHLELKSIPPQNRILIPFRIACAMDRTNPLFKSFFEPASKALCQILRCVIEFEYAPWLAS